MVADVEEFYQQCDPGLILLLLVYVFRFLCALSERDVSSFLLGTEI